MEGIVVLVLLGLLFMFVGSIFAFINASRINELQSAIRNLRDQLKALREQVDELKSKITHKPEIPPTKQESAQQGQKVIPKPAVVSQDTIKAMTPADTTAGTKSVSTEKSGVTPTETPPAKIESSQMPSEKSVPIDAQQASKSTAPAENISSPVSAAPQGEKPTDRSHAPINAPAPVKQAQPLIGKQVTAQISVQDSVPKTSATSNTDSANTPSLPTKEVVPQQINNVNSPNPSSHKNTTIEKDNDQNLFEAIIGKRWLTWAGIGIFFLGAVFFLKYAYDQNWLGGIITPPIRVGLIACVGIAGIVLGLRYMRKGWEALGQGLAGGGVSLLYLAIYGAVKPELFIVREPLFSMTTAFLLMLMVTAASMAVAVRFNAMIMAIIAVIGGFATPIMVSTGGGSREALFAYILILDLGVLGAAWFRRWHVLDVLAFAGTVIIYSGWFVSREAAPYSVTPLLLWLSIFHLIFLIVPFLFHWRHQTPVTVQRFTMVAGNLAFFMSYASYLLHGKHPMVLAGVFFALAVLYVVFGAITTKRIPGDQKVQQSFYALGVMLIMLSLLYCLPNEAVATAWFVESAVVLVLGLRYKHKSTLICAIVVYAIALLRLIFKQILMDMPSADPFIVNGWLVSLLIAPATIAVWAFLLQRETDKKKWALLCWWLSWVMVMLIGSLEIWRVNDSWIQIPIGTAMGLWWLIGAACLHVFAHFKKNRGILEAVCLPLIIAVLASLSGYWHVHDLSGWAVLNIRFVTLLFVFSAWVILLARLRKEPPSFGGPQLITQLTYLVSLLPLTIATLEVATWVDSPTHKNDYFKHLILVITWTGLAGVAAVAKKYIPTLQVAVAFCAPISLAIGGGFLLYKYDAGAIWPLLNDRCIATIAALVVGIRAMWIIPNQRWILSFVHLALTAVGIFESIAYCFGRFDKYERDGWVMWSLAMVLTASSFVGFWRVVRGEKLGVYLIGSLLLLLASVMALMQYAVKWPVHIPVVNLRFIAVITVLAVMVYVWRGLRHKRFGDMEDISSWYSIGIIIVAFIATTSETVTYAYDHVANKELAKRIANFSVTAVWAVIGLTSLYLGFIYRIRLVRFTALGLFGITAAKLLIYDMSGVNQLYRIGAFMLVGLVLIFASYLYHRLERRLSSEQDESPMPNNAPPPQ